MGVDPIVGLYTVPLALVGYAVFGGSRLLVVGPDAALSVLSAATVAPVLVGGEFLQLTIALAVMVGFIYLLMSVLHMGWIADLIPDPVLKGFIEGLVWVTILDQVPKILGVSVEGGHSGFFRKLVDVVEVLPDTHTETAIVGVGIYRKSPTVSYMCRPGTQPVPSLAAAKVLNRPHSITADAVIPGGGSEGVLVSRCGNDGNSSFYIKGG